MIQKPRFKYTFHVEVVQPQQVFLLKEYEYFLLSGEAYALVAPLLDGRHSVAQIITELDGQLSMGEVFQALTALEKKGYIVEADDSLPESVAAFYNALDIDTRVASSRLSDVQVSVTALGNTESQPLTTLLQGLGVQVAEGGQFKVVLSDDYLHPALAELNQQALQQGQPWMLIKPVGQVLWIGPIFRPGQTGCWACLAHRLDGNRQLEAYILKHLSRKAPLATSRPALPSTLNTALNLAATEVAKWIVGGHNPTLEGKLFTLDTRTLEMHSHILTRRPQCPACGTPLSPDRAPQPVELHSRKKTFTADGGHRSALPEQTYQRYQHHISPITGVVSALMRLDEEENGVSYTYAAGHNFAMLSDSMMVLRQNMRSRSGGKGRSDMQAKVSAICEAIERYSGVVRGDEIRVHASYRELGERVIHPNAAMTFSENQYHNRRAWNAKQISNHYHLVPEPLDENARIDWSPIYSLTNGDFKFLPTAFCYFGHHDLSKFFCASDANGGSAGNTMEEAILQGFMELVERDSVALWWYNRLQMPAVDLDSFDEPYFRTLKEFYRTRHHRDMWVLDLTSDLGIPVFAAVTRRFDHPVEDIVIGFGAHFEARMGIMRALTEANQFLPAVTHFGPDGNTQYWFEDMDAIAWWKSATLENQPYLTPRPSTPLKKQTDYARLSSDDLLTDVQTCVEIARRAGLETFVLDQTRPDVGLSVAKVMVPGLRHFWRRLGPGRLYDVPVKMGWLKAPLAEEDLNPISIFF